MTRKTIAQLEERIATLEQLNRFLQDQVSSLNSELIIFKESRQVVSQKEYDNLVAELQAEMQITKNYKQLYAELQERYKKVRENYIDRIEQLELERTKIKLNERGAGRKAFSNSDAIVQIYNLYISGNSLQEIADTLNRSDIKTARGGTWAKSSVRFVLQNTKNVEKGYISEELYKTVQELNKKRC